MRMPLSAILIIAVCGSVACTEQNQTPKSVDDYKAEATTLVKSYDVERALNLVDNAAVVFVDVREGNEISEKGTITNAVHIPRGVLEFYIDPKSSMHDEIFSSGKQIVFYCATGGRSLLAAKLASDMGVINPVYLDGGFEAWSEAGGPAITPPTKN